MAHRRSISDLPVVALPDDFATAPGPFLARMYAQHGPLFRTRSLGAQDILYLVGPEANRAVLVDQRHCLSNEIGWRRTQPAVGIFGRGLTFMDGAEHDSHRRVMAPAFTPKAVEDYLPRIHQAVRAACDGWAGRGEVDVYKEAHRLTVDVSASTLLGLREPGQIERLRTLYLRMFWLDQQAAATIPPPARPAWRTEQVQQIHAELDAFFRPIIAERRTAPTDDALGRLCGAAGEDTLTDRQIVEEANSLLLAGHITTTALCAWLMHLLAGHPDYLERVVTEQRVVVHGQDMSWAQIRRMEVLDRAVQEAERLYPPIALLPRGVAADFEFAGCRIPGGSFLFCGIAGSHWVDSIFARPERFDPDRFAPPRQEHVRTPYSLVGFSGGPRVCLGISVARVEIKALASQVIRRYHLAPVPGHNPVQVYQPISTPLNGVRLRISERGI